MKVDKRTSLRIDVKLSILRYGLAMNISAAGMCVIVDDPLPIDYFVELKLSLPDQINEREDSSNIISVEGVVVWTKFSEQLDKYEVGIKFTNLNADNKALVKSFIENYSHGNTS